jgi:hypothetical protein
MREYTKEYKEAVENAIKANHTLGLPAYQCKGGYIVAIYPDGREIKLQKAIVPHKNAE